MKKIQIQKLAIISFLFFHICMLIVFNIPEDWKPEKVKIYNSIYVKPFLYQKWNMFAPIAKYKINLQATLDKDCKASTGDSIWYPFKHNYDFHKYTWVTHHGKIALASMYYNFFAVFENDSNPSPIVYGDTSTINFKRLAHALKKQAEKEHINCKIKYLELRCVNIYNNEHKTIKYNL